MVREEAESNGGATRQSLEMDLSGKSGEAFKGSDMEKETGNEYQVGTAPGSPAFT